MMMREPNAGEKLRKQEALEQMREARWLLLERHPFIGHLAMHLELRAVTDGRLDTASTDGVRLYADAEYFLGLSAEQRIGIIAHEVWHCALRHPLRRGDRDLKRFNYAADIETDLLLTKDGFVIDLLPYDDSWNGQAAEWIYERIPDYLAQYQTPDQHFYPSPKVPFAPPVDDSDAGEDGAGGSESGASASDEAKEKNVASPSKTGKSLVRDPDFQIDFGEESAQEWEQIMEEEASKARGRGELPAHFEQYVAPAKERAQDWRTALLAYVTTLFSSELQWLPPSRRHAWQKLYLPGHPRKPFINLVVAVDTSGSVIDELPRFLTELGALAESFGDYIITLIQCDAAIQSVREYTNDDVFPKEGLAFHGLGGTDLRPPFRYVAEHLPEPPNVLVYLTDGDGPAPAQEPPYPVIWCLTPDGKRPATWGVALSMQHGEKDGD